MNASCQCGAVTFKTPLPQPLALFICHCDECKRQSSSAFGASAIFPRFPLPASELLSCYSRQTSTGQRLDCFFCKNCGTRIVHATPNKSVVSVKAGCLAELDWGKAKHIWVKRAMVPIPEGAEKNEEEPDNVDIYAMGQSDRAVTHPHEIM